MDSIRSGFRIDSDSAAKGGAADWQLYIIILFHQVLTASAFPIAKLGLNEIDAYTYAFLRFTIASIIYIPVLLKLRKYRKMSGRDHFRIFILGLIVIPLNQVVFLVGQSKTSAGHAALLFAMVPIFIYVLAVIFLKERILVRRVLGIVIAGAGVFLILYGGAERFGKEFLVGDMLILIAVIAWAGATIMAKSLALKYGAFRVIGLALVYGSAVYWPYGLFRALNAQLSDLRWTGWFSVIYMAIPVSVLAYFLWYWVLKYMEASRLAVIQNIQPVIAAAVAAVILAEPVSRNFILGGAVALTGVILTEIKQKAETLG